MTVPLPELLRSHLVASGAVEQAIFGTTDPEGIAAVVAGTAQDQTGVPVVAGIFYSASAGCVFGLQLADGRSVVLKATQPRWEPAFLRAVQRVQRAVAASGFPCPTPVAEPVPIGHGWATMESFLPDPGPLLPSGDTSLERSSSGLVRLLELAGGLDPGGLELHPHRLAEGALYPAPHSPIIDLDGTASGAEWIDEWAGAAWDRRASASLPIVIAHLDWSARNVRMGESGLVAVYDWDSVSVTSDAVTAGQAAATWRSTGETRDVRAPDAGEIERFIASFGRARGTPFSGLELGVARAAAVWIMAYAARCEHALAQRTPWRRDRARHWLRTQAAPLLDREVSAP